MEVFTQRITRNLSDASSTISENLFDNVKMSIPDSKSTAQLWRKASAMINNDIKEMRKLEATDRKTCMKKKYHEHYCGKNDHEHESDEDDDNCCEPENERKSTMDKLAEKMRSFSITSFTTK